MSFNGSQFNGAPFNGVAPTFGGGGGTVYTQTLSDAFDLYDLGGDLLTYQARVGDNAVLLDQTQSFSRRFRLAGDSIVLLDGFISQFFGGSVTYTKDALDAIVLTDQGQPRRLLNRAHSDALGVSDQLQKFRLLYRLHSDAATVTDGFLQSLLRTRLAQDLITLADSSSKTIIGEGTLYTRTSSDALVVTDANVATAIHNLLTTDALDVFDLGGKLRTFDLRYGDGITVTDGKVYSTSQGAIVRTVTDFLSVLDDGNYKSVEAVGTDEISLSDAASKSAIRVRFTSDTITVSDALLRWLLRVRRLEDLTEVVDSYIKSVVGSNVTYTNTLSDALAVTDGIVRTMLLRRVGSDTVAVLDEVTRWLRRVRRTDDGVVIADDLSKTITGSSVTYTDTLSDAVTLSDGAIRFLLLQRLGTDQAQIVDGFMQSLNRTRHAVDSVEIADGSLMFRLRTSLVSEALGISDSLVASYLPYVQYSYDVRVKFGATVDTVLGYRGDIRMGLGDTPILGGYN